MGIYNRDENETVKQSKMKCQWDDLIAGENVRNKHCNVKHVDFVATGLVATANVHF